MNSVDWNNKMTMPQIKLCEQEQSRQNDEAQNNCMFVSRFVPGHEMCTHVSCNGSTEWPTHKFYHHSYDTHNSRRMDDGAGNNRFQCTTLFVFGWMVDKIDLMVQPNNIQSVAPKQEHLPINPTTRDCPLRTSSTNALPTVDPLGQRFEMVCSSLVLKMNQWLHSCRSRSNRLNSMITYVHVGYISRYSFLGGCT